MQWYNVIDQLSFVILIVFFQPCGADLHKACGTRNRNQLEPGNDSVVVLVEGEVRGNWGTGGERWKQQHRVRELSPESPPSDSAVESPMSGNEARGSSLSLSVFIELAWQAAGGWERRALQAQTGFHEEKARKPVQPLKCAGKFHQLLKSWILKAPKFDISLVPSDSLKRKQKSWRKGKNRQQW